MTLSSSTFALPPRLAAKAAPELIADDEARFAAITAARRRAIDELEARLTALRLTDGGGGQQALDRDTEIHRLSAELRGLRRFGLDVCLGRMIPVGETEPIYVGRFGLADETGRRLLIDWRVPAAEPFFGATHATPMGLASRRRYRWNLGRVSDYWDEVFDLDAVDTQAALDDQSAFIASLGASRSPKMRDVLSTIQADQDSIIRRGSKGALVVDGGPGTGKTVVALHRTAFLMYADPRFGHRQGSVLFVGPHSQYLAYVADVLPSLGEESVQLATLRDLVPEGAGALPERDDAVTALKSSLTVVDAVRAAVRYHERPLVKPVLIETEWATVPLTTELWEAAFDAPEPGLSHNEAREQIWEELLQLLVDAIGGAAPESVVRRTLGEHQKLRLAFRKAWPLLDPASVIADLLSVPGFLRWCAPTLTEAEAQLLQRSDARAWTTADLPLLDAARRLVGDPFAERRRLEHAATLAEQREQMDQVVENLVEGDDDGEGLVTMLVVEDAAHSLVDESVLDIAPADELAGPFAHVVVDEAQELTDAEWTMLLARCPSRSFTIVGDRAQARHGFPQTWEQRLGAIGLHRVEVATLGINYRTPEEVMEVAAPEILAALPDANVPTSVRSSGIPVAYGRRGDLEGILDTWLAEHDDGVACVIGDPLRQDAPRVRSLTPTTAKGLEFDLVVLLDPQSFGDGIEGAVDRYVSMTRATSRLVVLYSR